MRQRGRIITFYSYKGGTGRTMALANVATLLARRNSPRVLVMDWDLEAPGLHRFFKNGDRTAPGVIDLLETLADDIGYRTSPLDEEKTKALVLAQPLERWIVSSASSPIDVISAGDYRSPSYARRVSDFPWEGLHVSAPHLFAKLAEALAERYDYVLIDSRTGLSDTSGICTAILPDKLVVVFTPNHQSVEGAVERGRAAVSYRRLSDDMRPLVVYPLASRVELSEEGLRHQWRHGDREASLTGYQPAFEQLLRDVYGLPRCDLQVWFDEVQIQHVARYAYGEEIVVRESDSLTDRLSLAHSYASLERALVETDGPWALRADRSTSSAAGNPREQLALERLDDEIVWHMESGDRGRHLLLVARLMQAIGGVVVTASAVFQAGSDSSFSMLTLPAAITVVVLVLATELFVTINGVGAWRQHAALAESLGQERFRYEVRGQEYNAVDDPLALLADRVSDKLDDAYDRWPNGHFFSELTPRPARRTYRIPSASQMPTRSDDPLPPR